MKPKTVLIFICAIILFLFIIAVFFRKGQLGEMPSARPTATPVIPFPSPSGTSGKVTIDGVTMNDFYAAADRLTVNNDIVIAETTQYSVEYMPKFNQFLISILGTPFDTARLAAEQQFLVRLGISREEACTLSVVISTPAFVHPDRVGQVYGLSFCTKEP